MKEAFTYSSSESLDEIRAFVRLVIESSMSTRRGFSAAAAAFRSIGEEIPTSFKDTKLVDNDGHPIVFFHGSRHDVQRFSREFLNTSGTNIATNYLGFFFTTSQETANVYISRRFDPRFGPRRGGHVDAFILNVQNPYYITERTYWTWGRGTQKEMDDLVISLKTRGYDAIVMPSVWRGRGDNKFDVVVFDEDQIYKL